MTLSRSYQRLRNLLRLVRAGEELRCGAQAERRMDVLPALPGTAPRLRLVPSHSLAHSRRPAPPPNSTRSVPTANANRLVGSSRRGLYASPCMRAAWRSATGGFRVCVWLACYWTVWRQVKNPMLTAAMAFHADGGTISRSTHRRAPRCAALCCGEGRYMAAIAGLSRRSWVGPNC